MIPFVFTLPEMRAIAGWIGSAFNANHAHAEEKKTEKKAALEALMGAVTETRQYLAVIKADVANKSPATEAHLAGLWSKAGIAMLPLDQQVANDYVLKANYWSDRGGWTGTEEERLRIELDEVFRVGRKALLGE